MTQSGQHYNGSQDRRSGRPEFHDMTVGDYANGMPNIRIGEMFKALFRQMFWLVPLVIIGALGALFLTKDIKRTYTGEGRILVQLGEEYTFSSVSGTTGQSLMLTPDIITLNETAIIQSQEVIQAVKTEIEKANLQQHFAPKVYNKIAAAGNDPVALTKAQLELNKFIEKSFAVTPHPKSSIVDVSFKHENGPMAVEVTKMFINAYLKQRQTIFVDGSADVISERRIATEEQLSKNEEEVQAFLRRNNISDFAAERTGAIQRLEGLRAELNTLSARTSETEAALASVESQLRQTPQEINLYQDDRAGQRLAQAELELNNLLARYQPGSDPVRAKQAEINQYRSFQSSRSGEAIGGRRVGANPVYQALMTRRNLLQSTADSLREKEITVQRQMNSAESKVTRFRRLSPAYQTLMREQTSLDQRHTGYTVKEQEAIINQRQADASSENVKIVSWPDLPRKGSNTRLIMALLITIGWGLTLGTIALLRVFLDPKLYATPAQFGRRSRDQNNYNASPPQYSPQTNNYVPEPVPPMPTEYSPARNPAPQRESYSPPQTGFAPVPYDAGGNAAFDMYSAPQNAVPVLGTVPTSEQG